MWRQNLVPVLVLFVLPWTLLQLLSSPSCTNSATRSPGRDAPQLTAMVVGDLHLAGPRTMWIDRVRREGFMKSSFKKIHQILRPHALIVLGDISDWGRKSSKEQWELVVKRFKAMMEPYIKAQLPIHVTVGNHDVGDCYQITPALLQQFTDSFPGLDKTGSELFTIRGVSFISLNAMALACDYGNPLHSSVRGLVEDVSTTLHNSSNGAESSRPVLLLHLPLFRVDETACGQFDVPKCAPWHEVEGGCLRFFERPQRQNNHIVY